MVDVRRFPIGKMPRGASQRSRAHRVARRARSARDCAATRRHPPTRPATSVQSETTVHKAAMHPYRARMLRIWIILELRNATYVLRVTTVPTETEPMSVRKVCSVNCFAVYGFVLNYSMLVNLDNYFSKVDKIYHFVFDEVHIVQLKSLWSRIL